MVERAARSVLRRSTQGNRIVTGRPRLLQACLLAVALWAVLLPRVGLAGERVALVIGAGNYSHVPSLANPANDAADISAALDRLGLASKLVIDPTYDDLRKALIEFSRRARGADIALVFYAGHGIALEGNNWLVPVDAELKTDLDVANEAIGLKSLIQSVSRASGLGLIILDACRDNPFAAKMARSKLTRSVARGFARVEPTSNVLVAYAAKDGTTARDGNRRNSPYTTALLRNLEIPRLELSFLFRNVRDEVMAATNRTQQPFVYGSLSSKPVYLNAAVAPATAAAPSAPPAAAPQASVAASDEVIWPTIKDSSDIQLLRDFLAKFPNSAHGADARARLDGLQSARDCDRLAGTDLERDRARSVAVVRDAKTKPDAATNACDEAMRQFPGVARFAFQAGRAAEARKNFATARALYEKAGAGGSAPAMLRLGLLYSEGHALAVDDAQARQWFEKAASQSLPAAMLRLGMLYEAGRGVERDYAEARRWYAKAADLGDWPAMMSLGRLYERGLGVTKDASEAHAWYQKAESRKSADRTAARSARHGSN
jgi:uncharacterized caspase-like protein